LGAVETRVRFREGENMISMRTLTSLVLCLLFVVGAVNSQSAGALQGGPDELVIGPFVSSQNIQGVVVNLPVTAFVKMVTAFDGVTVNLRLVGNLADVQQKIGGIIDTLPLPTNVCSHMGADNLVARIWGKQLTVSGNALTLNLQGDVNDWACAPNPLPCTKIDWQGGSIKFPVPVFWPCNPPIETQLVNQPFSASLSAVVHLLDRQTLGVNLLNPSINLGGTFGGITAGVLRIAGVDISQKASDALRQAIDPGKLRQTLPQELQSLNLSIASAGFTSVNGQALIGIQLTGKIPPAQLTQLLQKLVPTKPNQ
jgi:hypothetical protein